MQVLAPRAATVVLAPRVVTAAPVLPVLALVVALVLARLAPTPA